MPRGKIIKRWTTKHHWRWTGKGGRQWTHANLHKSHVIKRTTGCWHRPEVNLEASGTSTQVKPTLHRRTGGPAAGPAITITWGRGRALVHRNSRRADEVLVVVGASSGSTALQLSEPDTFGQHWIRSASLWRGWQMCSLEREGAPVWKRECVMIPLMSPKTPGFVQVIAAPFDALLLQQ